MLLLANCITVLNIMQVNFSPEICQKIFGSDYMHYWKKWTSTDGNIIEFINRLDQNNKTKIIKWGERMVNGRGKIDINR